MAASVDEPAPSARIYSGQLGCAPGDDLYAVLGLPHGSPPPAAFVLAREPDGAVVYRGLPGDLRPWGLSWHGNGGVGDTYILRPRRWQPAPGVYRFVAGEIRSAPFRLAAGIYDVRHTRPLYYFHVQRSGVETSWQALDGASGWHGPDHLDDARQGLPGDPGGGDPGLLQQAPLFAPGTHVDVSGGWFDAGDYNKYMGNTPWAVYNLLLAYESHPGYWNRVDGDGDGLPDILDEARWALDWMLKMTHADGSVYERIFNGYDAPFDGRPDLETDNVAGTADDRPLDTDRWADVTAKSAYAMATAYRAFRAVDGERAARYLDAARRAWQWALANRGTCQTQRYGGGLYFGDVRINLALGAAELFLATGQEVYRTYALAAARSHVARHEWTSVSAWEYHPSLALQRCHAISNDQTLSANIEELLARASRERIVRQRHNPYGVNDEWLFKSPRGAGFGQNDLAAASALDALWVYARTSDRAYRDYAVNEVQWIWGRNPIGICWLATRLAEHYPRVHHTRVTAYHPLEGVVVPGATDRDEDGRPDFLDNGEWYYGEPTINQQAVYLRCLAELHFASGGGDEWEHLPG